jgi:hypothetical protein
MDCNPYAFKAIARDFQGEFDPKGAVLRIRVA